MRDAQQQLGIHHTLAWPNLLLLLLLLLMLFPTRPGSFQALLLSPRPNLQRVCRIKVEGEAVAEAFVEVLGEAAKVAGASAGAGQGPCRQL